MKPQALKYLRWLCWTAFAAGLYLGLIVGAFADYSVDRYTGTVTNSKSEPQRKRVSIFAAVVTEGVAYQQWIPTVTRSDHSTNTHYTQYRIYVDGILVHTSAGLINPAGTGASWSGVAPYVGPTQTKSGVFTSRSIEQRIWSTSLGNAWGGWNTLGSGEIGNATTEYTEGTMERGGLVNQWEFEMPPNSSTTLNLEHSGPFYVVIEDYKQYLTPDGGEAYAWEELDEYTSTEVTEVSEETEAPEPNNQIDAPGVEYSSGDPITPATRKETVETLQDLDDNDEARHSDTAGVLGQIKTGVDKTVEVLSGMAGGGDLPATDHEAAADSLKEELSEFANNVDALADEVATMAGAISLGRPSGTPTFYYELDLPRAASPIIVSSNPTMDSWMVIVRGFLGASLSFGALVASIRIARSAIV